jgi:hypothetical protein
LPLLLPIPLGCVGVGLPVVFLVIRMIGTPLLSAVANYLGVLRVRGDLVAVVVVAAAALTARLTADTLVRTVLRGLKGLLAITTAIGRQQAGSSEVCWNNLLRKSEMNGSGEI